MDNKAGMKVPWLWTRRQLAKIWGIAPWEVDAVPWFEIDNEIRLSDLEAESTRRVNRKREQQDERKSKGRR